MKHGIPWRSCFPFRGHIKMKKLLAGFPPLAEIWGDGQMMESSQRVSWLSILWTNRITKLTKPIPSHLCWSLWTAKTKISYGQVAMGLPLPKASTRTMWTPRWWRSCFLPLCHWVGVLEPSEWLGHRHVDGGAGDELMSWRQKQHGLRWWWEHFGLGPWSSFPSQSLGSFPWSQIDDSKLLTTCLKVGMAFVVTIGTLVPWCWDHDLSLALPVLAQVHSAIPVAWTQFGRWKGPAA